MKEQEADMGNHEVSKKYCAVYFVHLNYRKMKQA